MNRQISWIGLAAMTLALPVLGQPQDADTQRQTNQAQMDSRRDADSVIKTWPENSRLTAQTMIDKYGPPDVATDRGISWNDKDPWSQVTVFREGATENFPTTHENVVENTIRYEVPPDKAGELIKFDPALSVHQTTGTLSARSDSEKANILALNLADEIVRGKRDVDSARDYMRSTLRKTMSGKSSPYTDHLLFPAQAKRAN
jgi:hypothetical protein